MGMRTAQRSCAALILLFAAGCSFLYREVALEQCATDSDCKARGVRFAATICREQVCVTPEPSGDGDGDEALGGRIQEPACTSNRDCIEANYGSPYLCRDGECVALTIPGECPLVLGAGQDNENLLKPAPIVFGAYSHVDPTAPRLAVPTLNYELAIDEVNQGTRGGLPGGPDGTLRPFVAVVCSGTNGPDLDASMSHLTQTLEVPAILSSLHAVDLVNSFLKYGLPSSTFFLSPLEADTELANIEDEGLLWHMLGSGRDLAPAYLPLVERSEAYLRTLHGLADSDPIRVALVEAKTPFLSDMTDELMKTLRVNELSALANESAGHLLRLRVDSSIEVNNPDISSALVALQAHRPHLVIAVMSGEFVTLLSSLESGWNPEWGAAPFYLASPYVFGRSDLASDQFATVHRRLLGVSLAGAEDTSLYDHYLSRLRSTYKVPFSLEGSENFYDAAYFLMYSIAAASNRSSLSGSRVAEGMTQLLSGETQFDVGLSDVGDVVRSLREEPSHSIELLGTMGPPDFDTSTGARRGLPSVYCIAAEQYVQDAMTYDPAGPTLSGDPPCLEDFAQ